MAEPRPFGSEENDFHGWEIYLLIAPFGILSQSGRLKES